MIVLEWLQSTLKSNMDKYLGNNYCLYYYLFYLGEENSKLLTELDKECKEVARLTLVESEVQRLKVELDEVQTKLKDTTVELDKIQARNKTMERHEKVVSIVLEWLTTFNYMAI